MKRLLGRCWLVDVYKRQGTTYATLAKLIPETDLDSVMINAGSMPLAIYPLSDYNTFLQAKGLQTISLNPDEAVLAAANEQAYDAISSVYNHCLLYTSRCV